MPNHWHLILWPQKDGELSRFVGWLTLTHTQRWHAHRGTAEGQTRSGAPVFNVALPLLRREHADTTVRVFDIEHDTESET